MHLIYDGSLEGFLSLVYEVYTKALHVDSISTCKTNSLFADTCEITTQQNNSERVYAGIKKSFTPKHRQTITNTFLCKGYSLEMELLAFIKLGFKEQKYLDDINRVCVFKLKELEKELFRVVHKMYGFIRFEELEDKTLYAKFNNKFNIILFLARHFSERLQGSNFILHDTRRDLAYVSKDGKGKLHNVHEADTPILSADEEKFKKLWQTFFHAVSIQERENKKLQQQFVPLIYREYMSEFNA